MRFHALISAGLLALVGPLAPAAAAADAADKPLTHQDCDGVALGRHEYQWGTKPTDKQQFKVFYRPSSSGGYAEQCPWSKYSITPPPIDSYDENGVSTGFIGPVYKNGAATVTIMNWIPWGNGWGMNSESCSLSVVGGHWTVRHCEPGART
jgi:hypothetical protein